MYVNTLYSKKDVICPCGCETIIINNELIHRLTAACLYAPHALIVSSWVRCPEYNQLKKGVHNSGHLSGEAVDILAVIETARFEIVQALIRAGFKRIILYKRHIHTDITTTKTTPYLTYKGG